jgi:hypothetical protein
MNPEQLPGHQFKPDLDIMARHIIQSIIQEMPESLGTTAMADAVWWRLEEIDNQDGLHPLEFNDVFYKFVDEYNGGVD